MIASLLAAPVSSQTEPMVLQGYALHKHLGRDLYLGKLETELPTASLNDLLLVDARARMSLRVLSKRWSSRSFEAYWRQALIINNSPDQIARLSDAIASFTGAVQSPLRMGDELVIEHSPSKSTTLWINGERRFRERSAADSFYRLLLRSWLGPRPPSSKFKRSILKPTSAASLAATYAATLPSKKRLAAAIKEKPQIAEPVVPPVDVEAVNKAAAEAKAVAEAEAIAKADAEAEALALAKEQEELARIEAERLAKEQAEIAAAQAKAEQKRLEKERIAKQVRLHVQYRKAVIRHVHQFIQYPRVALKREMQGAVQLSVALDAKGRLKEIKSIKGTKYKLLDNAAKKATLRADPFPEPPAAIAGEGVKVDFPIVFRIN